jgi:PAS domain S-box-containing protein
MTEVERRRRPRIRWIDRSIRSKTLAVFLCPTAILAAALASSAILTDRLVQRTVDLVALALALAVGLALWHFFTTGVVRRLDRLEQETGEIEAEQAGPPTPDGGTSQLTGRDEIGRLASRLEEAAEQVRLHAAERDRARRELTDILTASPVVSLRYDVASRRFSYASPNIGQLLGLSDEEAVADTDAVVGRFHPDDERRLRAALAEGRGQGDDRLSMMLRVRADLGAEDWREVEALYNVEADERGMPQTVSAYLVDVSARQAAQRSAEERRFMLESIFHASPDTIVVRDAAGKVLLTSSALAEVVGAAGGTPVDPDRVIEDAYRYGRLHRDERAALDRMLARCMAGQTDLEPVVTTGRAQGGEQELRTFETRAKPVFDENGRITGTVTVSRDITDRIRLEQSLRRATVDAERASEAKSQFLSRMSHELRTPLNAILGFAQLLELDPLPNDQASSVDQIQRAGRHLLSLINEVLDISRIEAGQLAVSSESVEVGQVLDEVTALLEPVAEAAAVNMMVEPSTLRDRHVRADRQRLRQVLLNLGSNAVKYNEPGGAVAFRTSLTGDGRLRFSVRDTGPGIPHEQQAQLFVPFSRLGAERSGVEGTGVGLALSKQLVELMSGAIGVDSAPGHGSTFWVELQTADEAGPRRARLPSKTPVLSETGPRTAAAPGGAGPGGEPELVVLHVEDDESNAALVALVLARRPRVRLVSAVEARLGLELARQHRPQLVLLDLHLPDLSGDELLARFKAMPELADTRVVVVSADATPGRIRRVLDLGVEAYLTKPVDVEALLQLVDDQLARRSATAP